jgi:hypothetical protein
MYGEVCKLRSVQIRRIEFGRIQIVEYFQDGEMWVAQAETGDFPQYGLVNPQLLLFRHLNRP